MTTKISFVLLLASISSIVSIAPSATSSPTPSPNPTPPSSISQRCPQTDAIPPVTVTISMGGDSITFDAGHSATGIVNGDGTFDFRGGRVVRDGWTLDYDLVVDPDPFIFSTVAITNTTAVPQQFSLAFGLPVGLMGPTTTMSAFARGLLYDRNADGTATCSFLGPGEGMFCLIDGAIMPSMTMLAGTTVTTSAPSTLIGPIAKLPTPGPTMVNSSLQVTLAFTLTAGDSVDLKGLFMVN